MVIKGNQMEGSVVGRREHLTQIEFRRVGRALALEPVPDEARNQMHSDALRRTQWSSRRGSHSRTVQVVAAMVRHDGHECMQIRQHVGQHEVQQRTAKALATKRPRQEQQRCRQ